jgi:hypothetical protein
MWRHVADELEKAASGADTVDGLRSSVFQRVIQAFAARLRSIVLV